MPQRRLKRSEKFQLMLDQEELKAIDDWRFKHRMPTRAAAIRELLRRGLLLLVDEAPLDGRALTSGDIRVIDEDVKRALRADAIKSRKASWSTPAQ